MKVGDLVKFKPSPFNPNQERKLHIVKRASSEDLQSEWVILHNYSKLPVATHLLEVISESR